jgi:stage II sporulation protein AA (anti-sigma F factor antagonist)
MITSTTAEPNSLCLRLAGALDGAGATALRPGFEALGTGGPRDVVLDLSRVSYLDGAGLGAVAYLYKRLVAQGRRLRLEGVTGQPLATLRQLGLGRVFGLEPRAARFGLPFGKGLAWAR